MEIQQLRHFLAVARYGSIGQAAEALNLSQPGLSRSIRALEETLGLALLERQARGVRLTDHGRQLLTRAEVILNEHDRALAEARSASNLRSGDISLGMHDVTQGIGALGALSSFLDSHPKVGMTLELSAGAALVEKIARAEIDIAFTLFPLELRPDLQFEKLFELPCRIYQRRGSAQSIQGVRDMADLIDHRWILTGAMNFRIAFEDRLASLNLPVPAQFIQSNSLALTLDLILAHDMLTILPEKMARSPQLAGKLETCDVIPPGGKPSGGLVYRREALRLPAIAGIANHLRKFCETL